jgi:hypothetical protein
MCREILIARLGLKLEAGQLVLFGKPPEPSSLVQKCCYDKPCKQGFCNQILRASAADRRTSYGVFSIILELWQLEIRSLILMLESQLGETNPENASRT